MENREKIPKISVIMPVYNGERFLRQSIESVLNQTFKDFEFIIVNDGSVDNSLNIIEKCAESDGRIKIIDQKNIGLAGSLNRGISTSKSEIVSIIEHDDVWKCEKLEKVIEVISKDKEKKDTGGGWIITHNAIEYNFNKKQFIKENSGNLSCLTITRGVSRILFPLPEENKKYLGIEDGLIAAEIITNKENKNIKEENIAHINEALTIMNISESSLSRQKNHAKIKNRYKVAFEKYYPLKNKYKELDELLRFWKRHYFYNSIIMFLPKIIRKIIYFFVGKVKNK